MDTSDPEYIVESETEVEITDLDMSPGTPPARFAGRSQRFSLRVRIGLGIAILAAVALLGALVLRSVLSSPEDSSLPLLPPQPQVHYTLSMTVVDGTGYAITANGVVSAFQISNGKLLWHHTMRNVGQGSITEANGVIYLVQKLLPYGSDTTTVTLEALRARDGSLLWSRTILWDASTPLQLTGANNDVYISTAANTIEALRSADGSLLWQYKTPVLSPFFSTVANGMVYLLTPKGQLFALDARTGSRSWTYNSSAPPEATSPPLIVDDEVFLSLQGGGMDVLRAGTGTLLWRYRPHVPALALYPQPSVASGAVYALTQDDHLLALRESTGAPIWSVQLPVAYLLPLLSIAGGVIYIEAFGGNSVVALRASTGSVLWSYQGREGGLISLTANQTMTYLAFSGEPGPIGTITALRASDGSVLWRYNSAPIPMTQLIPAPTGNLVLIALQDGNVTTLSASNGSLRWHRYVDG